MNQVATAENPVSKQTKKGKIEGLIGNLVGSYIILVRHLLLKSLQERLVEEWVDQYPSFLLL